MRKIKQKFKMAYLILITAWEIATTLIVSVVVGAVGVAGIAGVAGIDGVVPVVAVAHIAADIIGSALAIESTTATLIAAFRNEILFVLVVDLWATTSNISSILLLLWLNGIVRISATLISLRQWLPIQFGFQFHIFFVDFFFV